MNYAAVRKDLEGALEALLQGDSRETIGEELIASLGQLVHKELGLDPGNPLPPEQLLELKETFLNQMQAELERRAQQGTNQLLDFVVDQYSGEINAEDESRLRADLKAQFEPQLEGLLEADLEQHLDDILNSEDGESSELVRDDEVTAFPSVLPQSDAAFVYRAYFFASQAMEFFNIAFKDKDNNERNFRFSLLPAIESNLSHNTSASYLGGQGARVPEVKPGLLDRVNMKFLRKGVPGAPPAIQSMGIEQRIWQLVGLFLGNELSGPTAQGAYPPSGGLNAFDVADFFTTEVVMAGRPVDVTLVTYRPTEDQVQEIRYRAVIQMCRNLHARSDRTYYAFDLLVTKYYEAEASAEGAGEGDFEVPDGDLDWSDSDLAGPGFDYAGAGFVPPGSPIDPGAGSTSFNSPGFGFTAPTAPTAPTTALPGISRAGTGTSGNPFVTTGIANTPTSFAFGGNPLQTRAEDIRSGT